MKIYIKHDDLLVKREYPIDNEEAVKKVTDAGYEIILYPEIRGSVVGLRIDDDVIGTKYVPNNKSPRKAIEGLLDFAAMLIEGSVDLPDDEE